MIDQLAALLREERKAIAVIDVPALSEIAAKKDKMISDLRTTRAAIDPRALTELFSEAEANRVLIHDALEALREMLGVENSAGLYDARARVRSGTGSIVGTKL